MGVQISSGTCFVPGRLDTLPLAARWSPPRVSGVLTLLGRPTVEVKEQKAEAEFTLRVSAACRLQPFFSMTRWQRFARGTSTALLLAAAPAAAQGVGLQGGGTVSPNQFYVGSHFEVPLGSFPVSTPTQRRRWRWWRRNAGEHQLRVPIPLRSSFHHLGDLPGDRSRGEFHPVRRRDERSRRLQLRVWVRHESGFFSELKVGGSESSNLRYGFGFTINTGEPDP